MEERFLSRRETVGPGKTQAVVAGGLLAFLLCSLGCCVTLHKSLNFLGLTYIHTYRLAGEVLDYPLSSIRFL